MNSDLVPWHSLAGEITIPRGVVAVIVGEIGSSDKEADRHSVWGSVNIMLRYKYKNAKIPTEELKQETQSEWAQSRDEPFRKPNWSRDFEALGITEDFVIPEKRGRKIRKPN
jgi:hypothetical protein